MDEFTVVLPPHGTRARYMKGCGCDACKGANAQRKARDQRSRVEALSAPSAGAPGPVEAAILVELGELSQAVERPGLVALALSLARVMDGGIPTPKPAAAAKLMDVVDRLRKGSDLRKSRLAAVRDMSRSGS